MYDHGWKSLFQYYFEILKMSNLTALGIECEFHQQITISSSETVHQYMFGNECEYIYLIHNYQF